MTGPTILRTADDALKAWDEGAPLDVFEVASEGAPQRVIWSVAMGFLSGVVDKDGAQQLSNRELNAAREIAKAAKGHGWAKMLQIHADCKPLTIQREL